MDYVLPMELMMDRRSELFDGGLNVLAGFVDLMLLPGSIWKPGDMRGGFSKMEMSVLWGFVSSNFRSFVALKEEGSQTLWNAIFDSAVLILMRKTVSRLSIGICRLRTFWCSIWKLERRYSLPRLVLRRMFIWDGLQLLGMSIKGSWRQCGLQGLRVGIS